MSTPILDQTRRKKRKNSLKRGDSEFAGVVARINVARRTVNQNPAESLLLADDAAVSVLKLLCEKNGATDSSETEDHSGRKLRFGSWNFIHYLTYLKKCNKLSNYAEKVFIKLHDLRNNVRYRDAKSTALIAARAIEIVEYFANCAAENKSRSFNRSLPEGGLLRLPEIRRRVIARSEVPLWTKRGWTEGKIVGNGVQIKRRHYDKWETFEMKVRLLVKVLRFENCILDIEDFWYKALGHQIDACGGSDGVYFVIDCTSRKKLGSKSLNLKIDDILKKRDGIARKIDELYPNSYHTKIFAICTEDIEISAKDVERAAREGIRLLDSDQVSQWFKYYQMLGVGLKYHVMKTLTGFSPVWKDGAKDPFLHYEAFRIERDDKLLYSFVIEPEDLLKLAYVYRLDMADPIGYQRPLKPEKLARINDFLTQPGNYFANNIVLCLDSLLETEIWSDFDPVSRNNGTTCTLGTLHIPKIYCTAEIIDGQHRLYGYLDSTRNQQLKSILSKRRRTDSLSVMAVDDPDKNIRPLLYTQINSNQTKVNPRDTWALMARVRPEILMGFVARIVISLNQRPTFKNRIHIPGINSSKRKKMNIANIGNGFINRKLLNKEHEETWNLYTGDRDAEDYLTGKPDDASKVVDEFFKPFDTSPYNEFIFTNNGVNVLLRILTEVLKFEKIKKKRLSKQEIKEYIIAPTFAVLNRKKPDEWRAGTSNEQGRADAAAKIIAAIRRPKRMSAFAAGLFD